MDKKLIYLGIAVAIIAILFIVLTMPTIKVPVNDIELYTCNTVNDCTPVVCQCGCSGGLGFSYDEIINKEYVKYWYQDKGCSPNGACPEVICGPVEMVCKNNVCGVKTIEENQTECAKEGKSICSIDAYPDFCKSKGFEKTSCCEGLSALSSTLSMDDGGTCIISNTDPISYCMPCGDGNCELPENECNCPKDCKSEEPKVLFSKEASWGPCASENPDDCHTNLVVYNEGKIVKDGNTYYLDDMDLTAIITAIQESKVLDKECGNDLVLDYAAHYTINLNEKTKSVDFPNCEDEFGAIDKVIEGIIENSHPSTYLEIHEWGVLGGCAGNESYIVTSRPEELMYVDLPVVYVHSEGIDSITAEFTFAEGEPTDTYPGDVRLIGCVGCPGILRWENVMLNKPQVDETDMVEFDGMGNYRMPLEDLQPTLNKVDADTLYYGDDETKFLFYEGIIPYVNEVDVSFDINARTATFTNNGENTAYNVILSTMIGDYMNAKTLIASAGDLDVGETKTVPINDQNGAVLVNADMLNMGFTQMETDSFLSIWGNSFFSPSNVGFSQLIYRLPQSEYNEMLPARIDPEPDKMVRAMYVVADI